MSADRRIYFPPCIAASAARMHAKEFKRICDIMKAIGGQIYGPCVRDLILIDSPSHMELELDMRDIKCRCKDALHVQKCIAVLRVDYRVEYHMEQNDECVIDIFLQKPCHPGMITAHMLIINHLHWTLTRPVFDVDSLAYNMREMYIWPMQSSQSDLNIANVISGILGRRFKIYETIDTTHARALSYMSGAVELVKLGWTMQENGEKKNRKTFSVGMPDSTNKQCPICQEHLMKSSVIVRLHCQHIFHGDCICPWLRNNPTCPCCRADALV